MVSFLHLGHMRNVCVNNFPLYGRVQVSLASLKLNVLPAAKMSVEKLRVDGLGSNRCATVGPQSFAPLKPLRPAGCLPARRGWRKHFCGEKKLHDALACVRACLLGKEALAYIITHSLPFGGSRPRRRHRRHLSQPGPPSCTSSCLDLPDDLHDDGGPSCSSADAGLSSFKRSTSNLR